MSCDWSSYKIRTIQEAAEEAQQNARDAVRDIGRLKEQFDRIEADHRRILQNQERILSALDKLSGSVGAMHEEMYPKAETIKPALKPPGAPGP